jgi:hypothetical protein
LSRVILLTQVDQWNKEIINEWTLKRKLFKLNQNSKYLFDFVAFAPEVHGNIVMAVDVSDLSRRIAHFFQH